MKQFWLRLSLANPPPSPNKLQSKAEMGVDRFAKEYVVDMTVDIQMLVDYLGIKIGKNKPALTVRSTYSRMAEMTLKKEKVGWHVMCHGGEARLKAWLDKVIESGELGAVGDAPPDLLAELEVTEADMDLGLDDPEVEVMGGLEQAEVHSFHA